MEKLIALAESLDSARLAANAIEATAPTADAYGDIAKALQKVLVHIVGSKEEAERIYDLLNETGESLRWCLVAGYEVTSRPIGISWKVTDPEGKTVGRIFMKGKIEDYMKGKVEGYSPERAIDRVLPIEPTLDDAVFALVQDYRLNR